MSSVLEKMININIIREVAISSNTIIEVEAIIINMAATIKEISTAIDIMEAMVNSS